VDKYGNVRLKDYSTVWISAHRLGAEIPAGASVSISADSTLGIAVADSNAQHPGQNLNYTTGFWAKSSNVGDGLQFQVRGAAWGWSNPITVVSPTVAALASPSEVIAQDYMGAYNTGDQGGFVVVNFPATADHSSLTSYVIWREVLTTVVLGEDGSLVVLDEADAESKFIPWASVQPYPGVDVVRAVIATLDGDESYYAVSAHRGWEVSATAEEAMEEVAEEAATEEAATEEAATEEAAAKIAFANGATISSPYELISQTMVNSKAASALQDVPVFATLTPEALAFMDRGVVPNLNAVGTEFQSAKTVTDEAVRAIDNIAPEAVVSLRAFDTVGDAGSSISISWTKSVSDVSMTQVVANAIGASGNTFNTQGVMGYNIYRALGNDDEFQLVGKANTGETSFEDVTAMNGVRYSYKVVPYDNDNESITALTSSAMAIRNRVLDTNGQVVVGLFGADNKVGFDDFFIFADHFGLKGGEANFEAAFDLNMDNQINFADFFTFADNFGRSVDLAGKVIPTLAGLNSDARLDVTAADALPGVGEDMVIRVSLADFMEVKGYGFHMSFDSNELEFVKVAPMDNNILGESDLAHPQVIAHKDGELSIAAFGDVASEGLLDVNLVFRAKTEIEDGYIELSEGQLRDGSYGLNQVGSLGFVRIETRPEAFALNDNFPNPFNPETTIKYALPEAGSTKLVIYNVVGQVVRHLVTEQQSAGRYVIQWDATNDNGQALSSGVYFYHLQVGGEFQQVKRMLLLK
jgi:hypothetical protein